MYLTFQLKSGDGNNGMLWIAVGEDAVTLLDLETMSPLVRHPYSEVVTFGGCQDDLMLVVNPHQKLLFALSKPKVSGPRLRQSPAVCPADSFQSRRFCS